MVILENDNKGSKENCQHFAGIGENQGLTKLPKKDGRKFSLPCC
jgi:hypothetical protein